jgi:hypothetical protein
MLARRSSCVDGVRTVGVSKIMLIQMFSRQQISHEYVESAFVIDKLAFLVDHATILRNIPDQRTAIRSRDWLLELSVISVEPGFAIVVGVREVDAMVRVSVWCLSDRPRGVKFPIDIVQSVNVGVIVVSLDVHALGLPFPGG